MLSTPQDITNEAHSQSSLVQPLKANADAFV